MNLLKQLQHHTSKETCKKENKYTYNQRVGSFYFYVNTKYE
jgi:hypothetical protein